MNDEERIEEAHGLWQLAVARVAALAAVTASNSLVAAEAVKEEREAFERWSRLSADTRTPEQVAQQCVYWTPHAALVVCGRSTVPEARAAFAAAILEAEQRGAARERAACLVIATEMAEGEMAMHVPSATVANASRCPMSPEERAAAALGALEYDLTDRRGLKSEWRAIDDDIKAEIRGVWSGVIADAIRVAIEEERETCARIAADLASEWREGLTNYDPYGEMVEALDGVADAIRARGTP